MAAFSANDPTPSLVNFNENVQKMFGVSNRIFFFNRTFKKKKKNNKNKTLNVT